MIDVLNALRKSTVRQQKHVASLMAVAATPEIADDMLRRHDSLLDLMVVIDYTIKDLTAPGQEKS